ncbi:MAG: hypothetical protein NZ891_02165, partial [bacterium]|nr:hypothetical protein [bacterium]MDW8163530.1 hypothetical protein [Candidatus Omnitrophota bacterium]
DCLNYNTSFCFGKIEKFEKQKDIYRIRIKLFYLPDAWVSGGKGIYNLNFRIINNKIDGEYEGFFLPFKNPGFSTLLPDLNIFEAESNLINLNGKIYGEINEEKFLKMNGHPRLITNGKELNEIKDKLKKEPFKNYYESFKKSEDPVINGFMYFLTEDTNYSIKCRKIVENMMNDFTPGPFNLGHYHGERLRKISIAYDFCYKVWDEEFKNRVETYIRNLSERILLRPSSLSSKVNTHPVSNYSAKLNPGAFVGMLTLLGERYEKLPELKSPEILDIKPINTTIDIPFLSLQNLRMPEKWLFRGPFNNFLPYYDKNFYKEPIDIKNPEELKKFELLDEKYIRKKEGVVQGIDVLNSIGRKYLCCGYYLTGLENDKERYVKLNLKGPGEIYVNFQKVTTDDILKISKGKYVILLKVYNGLVYPWGENIFSFTLEEINEESAIKFIETKKQQFKIASEYYEILKEIYIEKEKENPFIYLLYELGKKRIEEYATLGLGEWGFNTEGDAYTSYSCDEVLLAATIYKKITGNDINKYNTIGKMPVSIFSLSLFNGKSEKIAYGGGRGILSNRHLSRVFPLIPDEYKDGILWFWNKLLKVDVKEEIKNIDEIPFVENTSEDLLYTFLFYPINRTPLPPEKMKFPKFIGDSLKGGFIFRNRFQDKEDIIVSIFGKSLPVRPCWQMNNAGDFRIWGLGVKWFIQGAEDKNLTSSIYQNVVQIQEREQNGLGGKIIFFNGNEDGSGVVSFDLSDVYRLKINDKLDSRDRYGEKIEENLKKENIRIIRSLGVDYSKLSGGDGLFVIVDYLEIEGEKLWQAVIGEDLIVEINGNEVNLKSKQTASNLKCWFFPKEEINIFYGSEVDFGGKKYSPFGGKKYLLWAKTKGNIIITIMSLQKGNPPELKVKEDRKFIIGRKCILFDGEKIVFENL